MDTAVSQPKKVLYLVNDLSRTFGWSTYAYLLALEAARAGIEVHVAVERLVPSVPPHIVQHQVLGAPVAVLWNPFRIIFQWIRLRRLIRSLSPDLIHVVAEPYLQVFALGVPRATPLILTIHGTYAYIPAGLRGFVRKCIGSFWFTKALRRVSAMVSVSEQTKRFFLAHTRGFSPDRIRVIHNAVNTVESYDHASNHTDTTEFLEVITIGAVKRRKGVHLSIPALAAWANARKRKVRYNVVGVLEHETPYVKDVMVCARTHESKYFSVVFHGSVTEERKRELLSAAKLYIHLEEVLPHTTDVEGFGIGIVEAAAYGVPALVLKGSATVEAVSPMHSGIVLETLEEEEVCGALDMLFSGTQFLDETVQKWAASFLPAAQFRTMCDLYRQVVGHSEVSVVISAAYGMGNLGDEAICTTVVHDIRAVMPAAHVTILVFDRSQFLSAHPEYRDDFRIRIRESFFLERRDYVVPRKLFDAFRAAHAIQKASLFVWGGGGLVRNRIDYLRHYLRPLIRASLYHRPILVYPIGVDVITQAEVRDALIALPSDIVWHVRDLESKENLDQIFNDRARAVRVIPDPVFHYPMLCQRRASSPHSHFRVGLNLAFRKAQNADSPELRSWIQELTGALVVLKGIVDRPLEIVSLPTDPKKDALCIELLTRSLLPTGIPLRITTPQTAEEFIEHARSLDLLVTSRMHALILSSFVSDLPVISFLYDEKVEHLSRVVLAQRCYYSMDDKLPVDLLAEILKGEYTGCVRDWRLSRDESLEIRKVLHGMSRASERI